MNIVLLVVLVALQVLDGALTYYGVAWAGLPEYNPLIVFFIETLGVLPGLLLAKGIGVVLVICVVRALSHIRSRRRRRFFVLSLWGLAAWYSLVVGGWIVVLFL